MLAKLSLERTGAGGLLSLGSLPYSVILVACVPGSSSNGAGVRRSLRRNMYAAECATAYVFFSRLF